MRARVRLQRAVIEKVKVKPRGVLAPGGLCRDARSRHAVGPLNAPRPHCAAPLWLQDLAGAWVFYSVLPAWPGPEPRFERIARFAPWIGAVIGGLQALLWWSTAAWLPPLAQIALVITLGLVLSGGLHADGVIDTADGLAAGPRALEAMDDSRAGAAGVQAFVLSLLLSAAGLLSLAAVVPPAGVAWVLLVSAVWGRISPLLAMARFPYLRDGGTAGFHRRGLRGLRRELLPAALLLLLLAGAALAAGAPALLLMLLLPALPALLLPLWLGRRLGGHSGDTYGACVGWTEALGVLLCGVLLSALAGTAAG